LTTLPGAAKDAALRTLLRFVRRRMPSMSPVRRTAYRCANHDCLAGTTWLAGSAFSCLVLLRCCSRSDFITKPADWPIRASPELAPHL